MINLVHSNKLNSNFSQFAWASLLLGWGLVVLLSQPIDAATTGQDQLPQLIQQVIDAPSGPDNGHSDQTPFVEAIEEVELSDESQDDEPSFKKRVNSAALTPLSEVFFGFSKHHAPRSAVVPPSASLPQQKRYLAYHQLKIDC